MNNLISKRQAVLILSCSMIATKFQRLPSLMTEVLNRDAWIFLTGWLIIDALILAFILFAFNKLGNKTIFQITQDGTGNVIKIILCILLICYFFFNTIITYKGTHEFFANTLFDKLSWEYFSFIFLLLLLLMVKNGLRIIGRNAEFYSFLIAFGVVVAIILGASTSKFYRLLPVLDIDIFDSLKNTIKFVPWFGDYMYMVLILGNVKDIEKDQKKFNKSVLLTFLISGLIIVAFFLVFYCVNQNLAQFQPNGLSAITQFSLIGLGIGRPDWFLVLFVFIATIIGTAFTIWCMCMACASIFNTKLRIWMVLAAIVVLYVGDIIVFYNIEYGIDIFKNYFSYYMLAVNILIPLLLLFCLIKKKCRGRKNVELLKKT